LLITDSGVLQNTGLVAAVERALEGGVRAIQLREKDLKLRELCRLAERLRSLTNSFGARLYINDRADVAVGVGADGVHLTSRSMPPEAVRGVLSERFTVGCSTHSLEEVLAAQGGGADYVTFGPVFDTPSKRAYGRPAGLETLAFVVRKAALPVFALGGITADRIQDVMKTGCQGVALISGILAAPDIRKEAETYMRILT